MTTLTMDMMREVMNKFGDIPPVTIIKCGNMDEFIAAIERKTGSKVYKSSSTLAYLDGIEVILSNNIPVDKAIVFEGDKIISIINLRDTAP